MSKLAHSCDETMAQIEADNARENGDLRRCLTCFAQNIVDNPVCRRGGVGCDVITVPPTMGPDPS